ncbi:MAG: hypothetical protein NZ518_01880 [Dehalococcoidia bacterium]|nr:hypothetical protein [Dehalococcoidia bacterium]
MALFLFLVFAVPWVMAPLSGVFGRRGGIGVALATVVTQAILLTFSPIDETFRVGGVSFMLSPMARVMMPMLLTAVAVACAFADDDTIIFLPSALIVNGAASGVLLIDNAFVASLFLQVAGILTLFASRSNRLSFSGGQAIAGAKYLALTVVSAVTLLAAFSMVETFRVTEQSRLLSQLILGLLIIGIGVRLALFPFHLWIADFFENAPAGTGLLVSVVVTIAAVGFAISAFNSLPWLLADNRNRELLAAGSAVGAFGGGLLALFAPNMRRLTAYVSVSLIGYVLFGIAYGAAETVTASVYLVMAHGAAFALLWLIINQIEQRTATTLFGAVTGLRAALPVTAAGFMVATFTLGGVPLLAAFPGRWLLWQASAQLGPIWVLVLLAANAMTLLALMRAFRMLFFGPPPDLRIKPPTVHEMVAVVGFSVGLIALGVGGGVLYAPLLTQVSTFAFLR